MNLRVEKIESWETHEWLLKKHYAGRIPSISFAFGLFDGRVLVGVCTIGKPASPFVCQGICGADNSEYVYELNRLCTNDDLPKNSNSFFIGSVLRSIPPMILISYSDTSMNHHGYIYQATNWMYLGLSCKRTDRNGDGTYHNRHAHYRVNSELIQRPRKHRYVYFTGTKRDKKRWGRQLKYEVKPYPKGDNKRYDASYNPTVQGRLF